MLHKEGIWIRNIKTSINNFLILVHLTCEYIYSSKVR